jgi:pilus assembly protein CpaF
MSSGRVLTDATTAFVAQPDVVRALGRARPDDDLAGDCREALRTVGWGPLQDLMDSADVEEIWWNDPAHVFCARGGRPELTTVALTEQEARDLVMRTVLACGRRLDTSRPFVDAQLSDGTRLHAVIPGITRRHWAVNLRRYVVRAAQLAELVAVDCLTEDAAELLRRSMAAGLNIVVTGGTQSGKTTFLNALLGELDSSERIISCEDVRELRVNHPDWVAMQTRDAGVEGSGAVGLRDLVREALRMRPTRVVIGEVRGGEALDLLLAMNCGVPCASTIHANSARDAITKLTGLPLLAGPNISGEFVRHTVDSCIELVVFLELLPTGRRVVGGISTVTRGAEGPLLGQVFVRAGDALVRGPAPWPVALGPGVPR